MITKLNETYSLVSGIGSLEEQRLTEFLKVQKPDAYFNKMVKLGLESPFRYFVAKAPGGLMIYNGHRYLLKSFGIYPSDEKSGVKEYKVDKFIAHLKLPFKPYDYQIQTIKKCLLNNKVLIKSCTGSGKSLSISVILEFFRRKGLKGILVVPNINLLTQFKNDIISYGLADLANEVRLLGNGNDSDFSTTVTITTLPEDPVAKMMLLGLFGEPNTVITSRELIDRGLATPVNIKAVVLNYPKNLCNQFRQLPDYQKQLKFIKDYEPREQIVVKIATSLREKGKNILVLFQHTEHGKQIYTDIVKALYPTVELKNSDITGKKSLEFQKGINVYFMNGEQSGAIRESQRNVIETIDGGIIVANMAVMSTGVNIKRLHCLVLASPIKAFTTVSQSLGRLMRKHETKKEAVVFDLVDNLGRSCVFMKQYKHRVDVSYRPEEFDIQEINVAVGEQK